MAEIAVSLIRYYRPTLLLLEIYLPTALVSGKPSRQTSPSDNFIYNFMFVEGLKDVVRPEFMRLEDWELARTREKSGGRKLHY